MRYSRVVRRFLLGYLVLHLLTAGFFVFVLTRIVRNQMIRDARAKMETMTTMLELQLLERPQGLKDPELVDFLKRLGEQTEMRFTLITSDGNVVADSITGTQDIGPHGTREEVLAAKQEGLGFSQRYSNTVNRPMMYLARSYVPSDSTQDGGFVRVAVPSESINAAIADIQKYVWIFAIAIGTLTAFLMAIFAAQSMQPLSLFSQAARRIGVGQYDSVPSVHHRNDEWGELGDAFQQMQTELTRREDRLLENSQRLEAVLSSMIEGVLAIEPTGEVMLANGAACRMFGLTHPELVGRRLLEIVRIPELTTAVEKTQLQRTFSQTEFKTLAGSQPAGPQRTLKARVSMLANDEKPGVAVVLHDVTELRQLETMRQDFVANVSHELKTPLSSIKAYAETLRLGALHDSEKNLQFVEQIEFQAEMLNQQIQDLLQLARVESGKTTFSLSDVNLNDICRSCVQQFVEISAEGGLDLQLALAEPGPVSHSDAESINTIVKNLVVNAIHYTPRNGSITVSTACDNSWALITVADTGIGIAADQQTRIFERFYRVDKARSRDMGGTGLGLAIVKHLSQAQGGSVVVESQPGKGSEFQVRLPLKQS